MARKHKHEEHQNHEAWAIPYGDLITLLLAFFVVMYSMSSVNEGKYRILADSLRAAFRGAPRTMEPIQIGTKNARTSQEQVQRNADPRTFMQLPPSPKDDSPRQDASKTLGERLSELLLDKEIAEALNQMADDVEQAMRPLIDSELVRVTRKKTWIEVEINTDILFPSGSAAITDDAEPVLRDIAAILAPFDNPIRVEGHTDNEPIRTREFPSNWELSAARAAGVVHLFTENGVDPVRMVVTGLGEHRPAAPNDTPVGRNRNRRVVITVLASPDMTPEFEGDQSTASLSEAEQVAEDAA